MSARTRARAHDPIWQRLEFGSYRGDLSLWEELAAGAEGRAVLELGAGAGRVAAHLARRGNRVLAIERVPELAAELERRAGASELPLTVLQSDLGSLTIDALPAPIGAAIAPLHVIQQLAPSARGSLLALLARALPSGGRLGATLVDEGSLVGGDTEPDPVPEMRDLDGWVYSSEPLWVQIDEETIRVRRLRTVVDPAGELERAVHDELLHRLRPDELDAEAAEAGFRAAERRPLATGRGEADSTAVILEAP